MEPRRRGEFIGILQSLLSRARQAKMPIVYIRHDGGEDELTPHTPAWEIASEIAPRPGEPIVDKRFRDAFRETNLADVLSALTIDHVIVAGMQSEFCVDATIREAERRGYRVTLVEDGHATYAAEGASEEDIRRQVNRVARWEVAALVPAALVFQPAAESANLPLTEDR